MPRRSGWGGGGDYWDDFPSSTPIRVRDGLKTKSERGAIGEKWDNVHACLRRGGRDLPGGITLAQLLEKERGVSNLKYRPRLGCRGGKV